jgi:hypothetical protein
MEWGIGGVKRKWKRFMEMFDSTQSKFKQLFQIIVIIINFLQRRCMDLTYEVVGDQNPNPIAHGWEGEF